MKKQYQQASKVTPPRSADVPSDEEIEKQAGIILNQYDPKELDWGQGFTSDDMLSAIETALRSRLGNQSTVTDEDTRIEKLDKDFIISALNAYWYQNHETANKKHAGDIERDQANKAMERSREIMKKLDAF